MAGKLLLVILGMSVWAIPALPGSTGPDPKIEGNTLIFEDQKVYHRRVQNFLP